MEEGPAFFLASSSNIKILREREKEKGLIKFQKTTNKQTKFKIQKKTERKEKKRKKKKGKERKGKKRKEKKNSQGAYF